MNMNKNNKEIEFNPDDLVKSVESFAQHIKNVHYQMYYLKEDLNEYKSFVKSLLNPEEYGYAVSAEVRDQARILLGMDPVESKLKK